MSNDSTGDDDAEAVAEEEIESLVEEDGDQATEDGTDDREAELDERERRLDQRERGIEQRAEELDERAAELDEREQELADLRDELTEFRQELEDKESTLTQRERDLDEREATIEKREEELAERATELDRHEETLHMYIQEQVDDLEDIIHNSVWSTLDAYESDREVSRFGTVGNLLIGLAGLALVVAGVAYGLGTTYGAFAAPVSSSAANLGISAVLIACGLAANLATVIDRL